MASAIRDGVDDPQFDLNQDGSLNESDRLTLIEDPDPYFFTYIGDSNLDKEFSSSDFVTVFRAGEYEDDIAGNSGWAEGDWNGDGDFNTSDFVAAFTDGNYEQGPRANALAVVPEPCAGTLIWLAFVTILIRNRR